LVASGAFDSLEPSEEVELGVPVLSVAAPLPVELGGAAEVEGFDE